MLRTDVSTRTFFAACMHPFHVIEVIHVWGCMRVSIWHTWMDEWMVCLLTRIFYIDTHACIRMHTLMCFNFLSVSRSEMYIQIFVIICIVHVHIFGCVLGFVCTCVRAYIYG